MSTSSRMGEVLASTTSNAPPGQQAAAVQYVDLEMDHELRRWLPREEDKYTAEFLCLILEAVKYPYQVPEVLANPDNANKIVHYVRSYYNGRMQRLTRPVPFANDAVLEPFTGPALSADVQSLQQAANVAKEELKWAEQCVQSGKLLAQLCDKMKCSNPQRAAAAAAELLMDQRVLHATRIKEEAARSAAGKARETCERVMQERKKLKDLRRKLKAQEVLEEELQQEANRAAEEEKKSRKDKSLTKKELREKYLQGLLLRQSHPPQLLKFCSTTAQAAQQVQQQQQQLCEAGFATKSGTRDTDNPYQQQQQHVVQRVLQQDGQCKTRQAQHKSKVTGSHVQQQPATRQHDCEEQPPQAMDQEVKLALPTQTHPAAGTTAREQVVPDSELLCEYLRVRQLLWWPEANVYFNWLTLLTDSREQMLKDVAASPCCAVDWAPLARIGHVLKQMWAREDDYGEYGVSALDLTTAFFKALPALEMTREQVQARYRYLLCELPPGSTDPLLLECHRRQQELAGDSEAAKAEMLLAATMEALATWNSQEDDKLKERVSKHALSWLWLERLQKFSVRRALWLHRRLLNSKGLKVDMHVMHDAYFDEELVFQRQLDVYNRSSYPCYEEVLSDSLLGAAAARTRPV